MRWQFLVPHGARGGVVAEFVYVVTFLGRFPLSVAFDYANTVSRGIHSGNYMLSTLINAATTWHKMYFPGCSRLACIAFDFKNKFVPNVPGLRRNEEEEAAEEEVTKPQGKCRLVRGGALWRPPTLWRPPGTPLHCKPDCPMDVHYGLSSDIPSDMSKSRKCPIEISNGYPLDRPPMHTVFGLSVLWTITIIGRLVWT